MAKKKEKQPKVLWFVYYKGNLVRSTHAVSAKQACSFVNYKGKFTYIFLEAFRTKAKEIGTKRPACFPYTFQLGVCKRCMYSENRIGLLCPNCGEADLQLHKEEEVENVFSI